MQRGAAFRLRRAGEAMAPDTKGRGAIRGRVRGRARRNGKRHSPAGDRPDFSLLPDAATSLLAGVTLKHIAPLFTTEFQRTTWQIETPTGHAEVALDNGRIIAGELQHSLCEVEIKLESGTPDCLFDIATLLLRDVRLHLGPAQQTETRFC